VRSEGAVRGTRSARGRRLRSPAATTNRYLRDGAILGTLMTVAAVWHDGLPSEWPAALGAVLGTWCALFVVASLVCFVVNRWWGS
jgi:hypothetical protein